MPCGCFCPPRAEILGRATARADRDELPQMMSAAVPGQDRYARGWSARRAPTRHTVSPATAPAENSVEGRASTVPVSVPDATPCTSANSQTTKFA